MDAPNALVSGYCVLPCKQMQVIHRQRASPFRRGQPVASRQIMYSREVSPLIPLQRCTHVEFTTTTTVAVTAGRPGKPITAGGLNCSCCRDVCDLYSMCKVVRFT